MTANQQRIAELIEKAAKWADIERGLEGVKGTAAKLRALTLSPDQCDVLTTYFERYEKDPGWVAIVTALRVALKIDLAGMDSLLSQL